ncbi:MAG: Rieske (2Fe-2S) protein, partial [Acidobacteria bacterium]|nr:Rieske (2Fe-2S) protein [Acidobacteriota bacterium]
MIIAESRKREAPESLMLTGFWYRALPGDRLKPEQLAKITLLEIPLVVGRDRQGRPFALRDACPHRGMPLSSGRLEGEQLECSYHGWRFDVHSGQCRLIPSLATEQSLKIDRIYAGNYACQEQDSFLWIFVPNPAPPGAGFTAREEP